MNDSCKKLREVITNIMWHFRGSLSREEAWTLSPQEREEYQADIKKRIELFEETNDAGFM